MQQVKIFKSVESQITELEAQVNQWIRQSGATVISIVGNIAPQSSGSESKTMGLGSSFTASDVMLIVLYETAGE